MQKEDKTVAGEKNSNSEGPLVHGLQVVRIQNTYIKQSHNTNLFGRRQNSVRVVDICFCRKRTEH
jgi:hypothetical protein